jgi:hypothetical protein
MRSHILIPLVAAVAALGALGCSSGSDGGAGSPMGSYQPGSSSGGQGGEGGAAGGDSGSVVIGADGGPVLGPDGGVMTMSACSAMDLVGQTQCGTGKACDVQRHSISIDAGAGGGGGGDGGGGGGGGGMEAGVAMGDGGGGGMGTGVGNETLICRGVTASGTEGVACNAADPTSCAAGYSCGAPPGAATASACYKFCNDDSQCKAPGGWCHAGPLETATGQGFTAKTCTLSCDPIAQKGCGAGQACNLGISTDRSRLYTNCIAAGTGGDQAACSVAEDCKAGLSCLKVSINGGPQQHMCLKGCVVGTTPTGCATGEACRAIPPPNSLGTAQYGWCY